MNKSLGNRLLLILLLLTLCVWVSVSSVIWMLGRAAIERQIDNQLRTLVSTVSYTIDAFITAGFSGAPQVSLLDYEIIDSNEGTVYTVKVPDPALPMSLNVWSGDVLRAMTQGSPLFEPPHQAGIVDTTLADGSQWRVIRSRLGDTNLWLVAGLKQGCTVGRVQAFAVRCAVAVAGGPATDRATDLLRRQKRLKAPAEPGTANQPTLFQ